MHFHPRLPLFRFPLSGFYLCVFLAAFLLITNGRRPNPVAAYPTGVIDLWGGAVESIALKANGTVWTWGWDDYGILGNGHGTTMFDPSTQYDSLVPFQVLGLNGVGYLNWVRFI